MPKDKKNPTNSQDKEVPRIEPEISSDIFSPEISKKIVDMVCKDADSYKSAQKEWTAQKELDLKHYDMAKPSELENLNKKDWMSDRNLGLAPAVADAYQATLLATTWTPETIHFQAIELDATGNKNNQEKFLKVIVGKQHCNVLPEVDDFIHNRIVLGTSYFKVRWEVWYEWIDRRIPVKKNGKTVRFELKTEYVRFEKGVLENISDIDDMLLPAYGKDIQKLPSFIHVLHFNGQDVINAGERGIYKNIDENYKKALKNVSYEDLKSSLSEEKLKELGITSSDAMEDLDSRNVPVSVYEWYGEYKIGKRKEKYRFTVDPVRKVLLAGKPLRKITRAGKYPFVGGALIRKPGILRGKSLMTLIAPIVNAFNNVFNQKSDFQFVNNCPFGFFKPDEEHTKQKYELEPMVLYPTDDPSGVNIPNLSRSMAWAESDIRILLEVLERLTGAASYFSTRGNQSKTATQSMLIDQNSDTRFGLWVSRIQGDIAEALSMLFQMYQDWAPPNLGEKLLGSDGKPLFQNLSVETLRGESEVQMTPDTVSGSKAYKKQLALWAFGNVQNTIWANPQVNPKGNYNLVSDTIKEVLGLSDTEIKRWLGAEPKGKDGDLAEIDTEWERFMRGDDFDPPEGETALSIQHLTGHLKQKEEKYHELAEEYRPNFDAHLFKTEVNKLKFIANVQKEMLANKIAQSMIMSQQGNMPAQGGMAQPGAGNAPGAPMDQPGSILPDSGQQQGVEGEEIPGQGTV